MNANKTLLQLKYRDVVMAYAKRENVPLREALDKFYNSQTYLETRERIADLHCRSDKYLAEEIVLEGKATGVNAH